MKVSIACMVTKEIEVEVDDRFKALADDSLSSMDERELRWELESVLYDKLPPEFSILSAYDAETDDILLEN